MQATLAHAWKQIVEDEDEMLLEIVADKVEVLCGYKPSPDMVAKFLKESDLIRSGVWPKLDLITANPPYLNPSARPTLDRSNAIGLTIDKKFYPAKHAIDVLRQLFEILTEKDPTFPERFTGLPLHGRTRRYLALDPSELYPGRPDLCRDCSVKLKSGYWLDTNYSRQSITTIIGLARDVARTGKGKEFIFNL